MDFSFTEEQLAVSEAAAGVFAGLVDPERVATVEATEDRIDRELWAGAGRGRPAGAGRARGRRRRRATG